MKTKGIHQDLKEEQFLELISKVSETNPTTVEEFSSDLLGIIHSGKTNRLMSRLLFSPLMEVLTFQGISDAVAISYMEAHGKVSYFKIQKEIRQAKRRNSICDKLQSFDSFKGCGYKKTGPSCNNQKMVDTCPLGKIDMLKGTLNIKAYSFYFYINDHCRGDLIGHWDDIINKHFNPVDGSGLKEAKNALVSDFTKVFGIGDKLANMTLSYFLMSDLENPSRLRLGQAMVAVDSLVHNFLHRTGILKFYKAEHNYGPLCSKHCLSVLDDITGKIDARDFNPDFPAYFPRFIQFSIWRFSSVTQGLSICNGVKINDTKPCNRDDICPVFSLCAHIPLKPQ